MEVIRMKEDDIKKVKAISVESGDDFWSESDNTPLFDEIVEVLSNAGHDLILVERFEMEEFAKISNLTIEDCDKFITKMLKKLELMK